MLEYNEDERSPNRIAIDDELETDPGLAAFIVMCAYDDDIVREFKRLQCEDGVGQKGVDGFVEFCADVYSRIPDADKPAVKTSTIH